MTRLQVTLLVIANVLAWLVIHMGLAWGGTQLDPRWFNPRAWPFLAMRWEQSGWIYEQVFVVKHWKDRLPDGSSWFRAGFPKKSLAHADPAYLEAFVRETCRGEAVHWAVFAASLLFFLWNTPGVGLVMVAYGAVVNVPCIIVQRYNRLRLQRILDRRCPLSAEDRNLRSVDSS